MNLDVDALPIDTRRPGPLAQYGAMWRGRVGTWWSLPVFVPLASLNGLRARAIDRGRLASVRSAHHRGVELPPIEIAVAEDGQSGWLIDGNHRLVAARRRGDEIVPAIFTVIGR